MNYEIISPFTGHPIGTAPDMGTEAVTEAISRAQAAGAAWRSRPWSERAQLLAAVGRLLQADQDAMSELLAKETGVTLLQAGFVVGKSAEEFAYWAGVPEQMTLTRHEGEPFGEHWVTLDELRRPHGVVAAILPYNASIMGAAAKMAPALLVGNTVVTKAPPQNPLAMLRLFEHLTTAGIDRDIAALITGRSPALGATLVEDHRVRMISFTGSTSVGVMIQQEAAKRLARTALELGGKGALVALSDADVDGVVAALTGVWTRQAGQICSIPSRGIVHVDIYDTVRDRLAQVLSELDYATHWDSSSAPSVGPVITVAHAERVEDLVRRSKGPYAQVTRGAEPPSAFHVRPTLVETTDTATAAFREEAFGPVLTLVAATDDADAIRLANDSEYGLVSYVYSADPARAAHIAQRIESGAIVVNGVGRHSLASSGGVKASGIAREGRIASLDIYTEPVSLSWTARVR